MEPPISYSYDLERCHLAGEITGADIARYHWPNLHDPGRIRSLKEEVERLRRETDHPIVPMSTKNVRER